MRRERPNPQKQPHPVAEAINRIMHKTLDKLYAGIGEAGTGRSGVGELCALAALSANLYTLVCVAPWLDEEYGSAGELRGRIREVAAALVCRLERETDDLERVRGVNALFVLSNTAAEYEQKMLDLAEPVLGRYEAGRPTAEAALFEAEVCRMMCNCYCLVQDEALAADARTIISGWTEKRMSDCADSEVLRDVRIARAEAVRAYADYTGDETFVEFVVEMSVAAPTVPASGRMPDGDIERIAWRMNTVVERRLAELQCVTDEGVFDSIAYGNDK